MTPAAKRGLFGLALILVVAVAFTAGMHWSAGTGSGMFAHSCEPEAAGSGSMEGCPVMGMDHEAMAATVKNAAEPTSAAGCAMPGMGCGSMESPGISQANAYPLDTCPVTGKKLGTMGEPAVKKYEGREVRFCCGGCPEKFEQDLQANLKKLDAAIAKIQEAKRDITVENQHAAHQGMPASDRQGHANMH